MMKTFKIMLLLIVLTVAACAFSFFTDKSNFGNWTIEYKSKDSINWIKFYWAHGTVSDSTVQRTAMMIPAKISGLNNPISFQFDLGSFRTELYEYNLRSAAKNSSDVLKNISRLKSPLQFWNSNQSFKNLEVDFGEITLKATDTYLHKNYGDSFSVSSPNDTLHIGTLGADVFQNKVLIIDYPNERFAICDKLPTGFNASFVPIQINSNGNPILPLKIHGHQYQINFDNGSSLFPLTTLDTNMHFFASGPDIDTIAISSWGQKHQLTGKLIRDSFELAGKRFSNVMIYANHSGLGIDHSTDGMAGNALFWNNTIIIDFKNKVFGIQ